MDDVVLKRLEEQEKKIDAIYVSVEKTRKAFTVTLIITAICIVLPLIGIAVIFPYYLNTLTFSDLGL